MNKDLLPLDERKLSRLEGSCRDYDVALMNLPEYFGESSSHPVCKSLVAIVNECVEWLNAMNTDEIELVRRSLYPFYQSVLGDVPSYGLNKIYLKRLSIYYVATKLDERNRSIADTLSEEISRSRVLATYPELEHHLDSDNLLHVGPDMKLLDIGILYKNHLLHYHRFLRGGFTYSSRTNADFTWSFGQYYRNPSNTNSFRIAVDHSRLMPKESYEEVIELSRWFGPRFGREKLDNPQVVGLTVIGRDEPELSSMTNSSFLSRTEFYWKYKDAVKTLEVEEISTREHDLGNHYLNRYVHAERDVESQVLRHFDGAVKIYTRDQYENRLSVNLPREERCRKVKLFRIDGDIDIDCWLDLVGYYFFGNEMVLEYFDPDQYHEHFG